MMLLLMLASVQFTSIVDFMVVMPLGPQLMRTLEITPSRFGLIVSSYTIAAGIAGILASSVMDRFGRKAAFLTLYAGFLVGTLLCGLAGDYATLMAARVRHGCVRRHLGGMALAIVGDVFPEHERGRATGMLMSAFALASVVGVPVGSPWGTDSAGTRRSWSWRPWDCRCCSPPSDAAAAARPPPSGVRTPLRSPSWSRRSASRTTCARSPWSSTMMLGGFAVIPYISVYLVGNVGVREDGPPDHLRHRRLADARGGPDCWPARRPLRQAPGLPRGRDDLGGHDARS